MSKNQSTRNRIVLRDSGPWDSGAAIDITRHKDGTVSLRMPVRAAERMLSEASSGAIASYAIHSKGGEFGDQAPMDWTDYLAIHAAESAVRAIHEPLRREALSEALRRHDKARAAYVAEGGSNGYTGIGLVG